MKSSDEEVTRKKLSWKTRECKFFLRGLCKHKDQANCNFIHPESESKNDAEKKDHGYDTIKDHKSIEEEVSFLDERLRKLKRYMKDPQKRN